MRTARTHDTHDTREHTHTRTRLVCVCVCVCMQAGFDAKKLAQLICQLMQFQEDTLGREVRHECVGVGVGWVGGGWGVGGWGGQELMDKGGGSGRESR